MSIIGIGGIFFKAEDPKKLKAWYEENLGINGIFRWKSKDNQAPYFTIWNAFEPSSAIFAQTNKHYVINYCVDDLVALLEELKKNGVAISGKTDKDEYGEFSYATDPDGNKIILWQSSGKDPAIPLSKIDRVTGLGGVFFKSDDAKKLNEWYAANLGIAVTEWGSSFEWIDPNNPAAKVPASTSWSIFKSDTKYLDPSNKQFMFNYRVKDLVALLKALELKGVTMAGEMQEFSYGKFGWIMDPEGNKIELWEPKDDGF